MTSRSHRRQTGTLARRTVLAGAAAALGLSTGTAGLAGTAMRDRPADPDPAHWARQVSEERLRETVRALSAFRTRWSESPDFPKVEDWVENAFFAAGAPRSAVMRQPFALPSGPVLHNILCGNPRDDAGVVLLGAHYDSISEQPRTLAPGANDNASGMAVLLEAVRILGGQPFGRAIVFAAFAGEEQGYIGSTACAKAAAIQQWPIALMINLDMLGFDPKHPEDPVFIEHDQGNATPSNDDAARRAAMLAAGVAADITTLPIEHTDIWNSDYMPFEEAGYPCIGFYDGGAEPPLYHTSRDLARTMNFPRLTEVARLVIATLAAVATAG